MRFEKQARYTLPRLLAAVGHRAKKNDWPDANNPGLRT
jgi:hypothetical protein